MPTSSVCVSLGAVESLLREESRLPGLQNHCRLDGKLVRMEVWDGNGPLACVFSADDLEIVRAMGGFLACVLLKGSSAVQGNHRSGSKRENGVASSGYRAGGGRSAPQFWLAGRGSGEWGLSGL
jgi:hypothetical protein